MSNIKKLTLLHSNDMHGDFLAERIDQRLVGGVSMLSGYLNKVRAEEENVVYAIAGDMFKGSVIDSEFLGISTIELMNMLAPDAVAVGNHEIDYGIAHLLFLERCAKFPIVNANLFIKTNHIRLFAPYTVVERDGLKVMFIGILTEEVLSQAKNDGLIGSFIDIREAAREISVICDTYKTTDIDLTVLLSHVGFDKDQELAKLIDKRWGVDLIIGGHTHTMLDEPCVVNGIPIVQVGSGTDQIGRFDIKYDKYTRKMISMEWKNIPINSENCPTDPAMEDVLLHYKDQTDKKYQRIITTFARKLTHPSRTQETELGNLFADIIQSVASFDIMMYGSGSIRTEALGPVVLYQDLKESSPYDDAVYMVEVTGEQFRRMIKFMLRDEAFLGHTEFYQFSKGLRMVYSRSRREFLEFKFEGADITPERRLTIGLQQFHYKNFDDFFNVPLEEVSKNRKPRMVATSIFGALEELFASSNHLDAHVEGRLEIVE